jgi:hypothetical protein
MPVANGMPLAAIGAREEVPPCCVTVVSAYACCQVAASARLSGKLSKLQIAVVGLRGRHLYGRTRRRRSALSATM